MIWKKVIHWNQTIAVFFAKCNKFKRTPAISSTTPTHPMSMKGIYNSYPMPWPGGPPRAYAHRNGRPRDNMRIIFWL